MFLRSTTTSGRAKFQKIPCISPLTGNLELETGFAELAAPPPSPLFWRFAETVEKGPLLAGFFVSALTDRGLRSRKSGYFDPGLRSQDSRSWEALTVVLEMPGVDRNSIEASVEDDIVTIAGRIDFTKYEGMQPVYTEYNVGNYARSFEISNKIDQSRISAQMKDGVVTLVLPKAEQAKSRKIQVS